MNKINWKKYAIEFFSIFIAVVSAFALTNWNDNRNSELSEQKILIEIKNGIEKDIQDFDSNISGHNMSLKANKVFRDLVEQKNISQESIGLLYVSVFRDYSSLINRSGYESLKASGLKTISNDSLRLQIITLYDYYYGIVDIIDNVNEMQSFGNYFDPINKLLHPYMEFDSEGNLIKISEPKDLSEVQVKEVLSYLWRLENNRKYKLAKFKSIMKIMKEVKKSIEQELKQ
ncbi:MAG: hypothetical protein ACPGJI_04255 [Kangiellaceae bacterium]